MPLITVDTIGFEKNNKSILHNVSFTLNEDSIMTIVGPNGAGKTTLLKLILGLEKPTSGRIIKKPKLSIGYMPQKLKIQPTLPLTVLDFLNIWGTFDLSTIRKTLDDVGMGEKEKYSMHTLSGGEVQRVLLARAILVKPDILVLDEPIQGVDIAGQSDLYKLILDIKKRFRCSVLLVSHDLHLVLKSSDIVVCLNGHICCSGSPESIAQAPEYQTLFGHKSTQELALYTHDHDHEHDPVSGECQNKETCHE